MKNIILLLIVLISVSCQNESKQISNLELDSIKKETNKIVNSWHKAAAEANFEGYFGLMDSVSVFIGTDASENWNKNKFQAFSKPYFDKGKAWDFETLERNIYVNSSGEFVWFDELLKTWMGTCRGSGVLEKIENSWKIKHYVLSVSIPNEDINRVITIKKKNDSIFLKKFN
ncbi:MAG: nuclear transport factor 2 family protein [Polaribacter sp.]|nr:nuclear transport factor 2 family protein [Polaribacter sp.]MDG1194415.1 nuclear transport factor 2 family protein [Polaribacter sp.]MDG2437561.1 nuclear transport factor 2 family protein [Polaribacter sp.]